MSTVDYERLAGFAEDTRKSYRTEDMPADSVALFLGGLEPGEGETDRAD